MCEGKNGVYTENLTLPDEGLKMPSRQTIKPLWKIVRDNLGLDPSNVEDEDISRIYTGLASIVDGIGALRTHQGSAYGRGRKSFHLEPRHARIAIHASHTLVFFVIETWKARQIKKS